MIIELNRVNYFYRFILLKLDEKDAEAKGVAGNALLKQLLNNKQKDSNTMEAENVPHSHSPNVPLTPQQQHQLALIESMPMHIEREEWTDRSPMPQHPIMHHHVSPEHMHMMPHQTLPPSAVVIQDEAKKKVGQKQQRQRKRKEGNCNLHS